MEALCLITLVLKACCNTYSPLLRYLSWLHIHLLLLECSIAWAPYLHELLRHWEFPFVKWGVPRWFAIFVQFCRMKVANNDIVLAFVHGLELVLDMGDIAQAI